MTEVKNVMLAVLGIKKIKMMMMMMIIIIIMKIFTYSRSVSGS